jgi:serine/threonine-protein kinase
MASKILAGRYELLGKRGDGGMAVVYKAKDRLLNRFVAIKILKPEFIRDPKFVDSFRRESQAAAGLSHPNVVSVYDVGKEGNIYYIVMEMMEGDTLSDVIRREAPMSEKRVLEISRQIAAALSAAHKKNIIHRDIKPHNIIFSDDGVAKITDFGIAKAVNSGTIVNTNATVLGSVHYLSPEQARGGFVDAKSDLYSLGIVMYEMLTGTVPFDGENAVSVAMMHINGDVPAPSIANPSVSALMDAIVLKAAARRPEDRFSSADELIAALTNASEGIAILSSGTKKSYGRDDFYAVEHDPRHDDEVEVSSFEDLSESNDDRAMNNHKNNKKQKNEPASDQKKARRSQILAVVLALVCAVPLSIILLNSCSGTSSKTVDVPNVIGMTEEQAADELDKYGLEYKLGIPAISDEYEEGQVISSDPDAGEKVKKGFTVTLVLSRGTDATTVKMPTFLTQKLREAETMLEAYDLKKGEITYEESDMPEGTIISQDPEPGTVVDVNTKVNFVISQGEEDKGIEVPDLSEKTEKQAKKMLEDLGLRLGKVSKAYSSDVEENLVISQTKEAGTSANEGDSVGITLSMGPEPSAEPVDIPLNIDYDKASNEVFTLTVTVTDNNGLHYVINNESRIKSDGSETVTLSGTGSGTVRVIMDNEIVYEGNADFDTGVLS